MVRYAKNENSEVKGMIVRTNEGIKMKLQGEKYLFPGHPRGHILTSDYYYTNFSVLKHQIKNKIFNYVWAELEKGTKDDIIIKEIKRVIFEELSPILEESRFDFLPKDKLCIPVKELWRAMSLLEKESSYVKILKEVLCFIFQEDDGYRFRWLWVNDRISWWMRWMGAERLIKDFEKALIYLENAEMIGDMKDKIRLLRRGLILVLKDDNIRNLFIKLFKELNWKKIKTTKADRYYFRGKYFKTDHRKRILGFDFEAYDY